MPQSVKTLIQIADEYGIHANTLRRWIKPIKPKLKIKHRCLLVQWQVDMIYEFLNHK